MSTWRWNSILFVSVLCLSGFGFVGCELDEDDEDATSGTESSGTESSEEGTGGTDSVCGDGVCDSDETFSSCPDDCPDDVTGPSECEGLGCGADGICCFDCVDGCSVSDPDCNPTLPGCSDSGDNDAAPNGCNCDYWGTVCEAEAKCTANVCDCDADCGLTGADACVAVDGHCDTFCPEDGDPNCAGSSDDGKFCQDPSCDQTANNCDANFSGSADCSDDPDCDGIDLSCEGDGFCDSKCGDADPDCG